MKWAVVSGFLFLTADFCWPAEVWQTAEDGRRYRMLPTAGEPGHAGFQALDAEAVGMVFRNDLSPVWYRTNQILLNGSGVSLGDVNGDGWCDVYATALEGNNALFLNEGGWSFKDVAASAKVACKRLFSTGSSLVDLDGDRDLDLLVATVWNGVRLFRNDGAARFADVTEMSGLDSGLGGMSLAVGDYDRDGWLDVYVANYRASALMDIPNARAHFGVKAGKRIITHFNGRPVSAPDLAGRFYVDERGGLGENGETDRLYRNLGDLKFAPVSFTGGVFRDEAGEPLAEPARDWGLAVMFRDINQDGFPDLYVCNDFDTPDRIWINRRDGTFGALPAEAMRHSSWFSMGVDFADVNRDGWDDFLTLDMLGSSHLARMTQLGDVAPPQRLIQNPKARPQFLQTCLFLNEGNGLYTEVGQWAGLSATDWAWCPVFLDVDLDGWEDLLVTNGNERDGRNLDVAAVLKKLRAERSMSDEEIFTERMRFSRLPSADLAYRNNRDGTFTEMGREWGFAHYGVSHGMALGDLDNDGDLDVIVNRLNEPLGVYRNESGQARIAVRLRGRAPNTAGIGARITLSAAGAASQSQEVIAGGRYLSSDDSMRVFAALGADSSRVLEVLWPQGRRSILRDVRANGLYEVRELAAGEPLSESPSTERPAFWFDDVSERVGFEHRRQSADDFARQPLLLRRYSALGPGISWHDIDADGYEDLIVGNGRGGVPGIFRNNAGGVFAVYRRPPFDRPLQRGQTTLLGVSLGRGDPAVLIGASNYEDGLALGAAVGLFRFRARSPTTVLSGLASSVGPLALADVDQDGDLDLFVGGRLVPGGIPRPAVSVFLRNDAGRWTRDAALDAVLGSLGMVSGAVFTDVDGDADSDLVLALEWGSLELLINDGGQLHRAADEWGLGGVSGWWNGVQAGDFNADGKMDLAATNWGWNSPYQRYAARPLTVFFADADRNGQTDSIVGAFDAERQQMVPIRQLGELAGGLPQLRRLFGSHRAFAEADTAALLRHWDADWSALSAGVFASTVFLNEGNRFVPKPLPPQAQWSPAFGAAVADFDADGKEDLFLAQNFFGVRRNVTRYDAGRGLLLRGRGDGMFDIVPSRESGVRILGEQRGVAVADFDRDGRVDLAVSQNGGPVKLYRNRRERRGLQVRLVGTAGNPSAVGASLWLSSNAGRGPRREIRAGAGYWSQDGAAQVLTIPGTAERLTVVWPDGFRATHDLQPGDRELIVHRGGKVERISD